jgi:hypothetical protein
VTIRSGVAAVVLAWVWLQTAAPAPARHPRGHPAVAEGAVAILPAELPDYFRAAADSIAHHSVDPDVWRNRATPRLTAATVPRHYVHLDAAGEGELVPTIAELTERLTVVFAEHRRRPEDPDVRAASLVIAGWLAHFAADLAQPLHTSIHHDGWALPDGSSPVDGIHATVDGLLERAVTDPVAAVAGIEPLDIQDLDAAIAGELASAHAELDAAYGAVAAIEIGSGEPGSAAAAFACRRFAAAVRFLAGLYREAWRRSASVELPRWLEGARAD